MTDQNATAEREHAGPHVLTLSVAISSARQALDAYQQAHDSGVIYGPESTRAEDRPHFHLGRLSTALETLIASAERAAVSAS